MIRGIDGVELFDLLHLGVEVAVLARAVGVLEVDEEEVVLAPVLLPARRSARPASGPCRRSPCRPAGPGPCTSDRRRSPRPSGHRLPRSSADSGRPAKPRSVRPLAFFSPASSFVAAAIHWLATSAVFWLPASLRLGRKRRHADGLRIGVVHVARPGPARERRRRSDAPSPARRRSRTPGILTSRSRMASGALSSVGMRPARRSLILPAASSVQKLPRAATSPGCMAKPMPVASKRPAADEVFERVVAKQAQVARPAAGSDAGTDRNAAALHADFGQGIEVRRLGRFQLRLAARRQRQAAQAVGDEHDDLRVVLDVQFAGEGVGVHGRVQGSGFRGQEQSGIVCCHRKLRQSTRTRARCCVSAQRAILTSSLLTPDP